MHPESVILDLLFYLFIVYLNWQGNLKSYCFALHILLTEFKVERLREFDGKLFRFLFLFQFPKLISVSKTHFSFVSFRLFFLPEWSNFSWSFEKQWICCKIIENSDEKCSVPPVFRRFPSIFEGRTEFLFAEKSYLIMWRCQKFGHFFRS
jgi:hypothetical protein